MKDYLLDFAESAVDFVELIWALLFEPSFLESQAYWPTVALIVIFGIVAAWSVLH